MEIPIYQVDAFARRQFAGNPAAVCPLLEWLPAETMQAIAAENNLAETAFLVGEGQRYGLRWFTPTREVDLCGHATLASAYVLFQHQGVSGDEIRFDTRSGELVVRREGGRLCLDFPSRPPARCQAEPDWIEALGRRPLEMLKADYYMAVYASQEEVAALDPDFRRLLEAGTGVIATAPGREADFVSRFFAPSFGIDEDPATGSSHCTLAPYWSQRLGKKALAARQISARGGEMWVEDRGDRVLIAGYASPYLHGTIQV